MNRIGGGAFVSPSVLKIFQGGHALVPIVWDGDTPYITWNMDMFFTGMNAASGNYHARAYLFLLGVET